METFPIGTKLSKGQRVQTDHRIQSTPIIMYKEIDPASKKTRRKIAKKKKQPDPAQTKTNVKISKLKLKNLN